MARTKKIYRLRMADGQVIDLTASSRTAAITEALARFGATLEGSEVETTSAQQWETRVEQVRRGTKAERWHVEALMRFRGIGDSTCHHLCRLVRGATESAVLAILRGQTRQHAADIARILNASSLDVVMLNMATSLPARSDTRRQASGSADP